MFNRDNVSSILDGDVFDSNGNKIGSVGQVYLDDATGEPTWVSIKTGWFGGSQSFVPLSDASSDQNGVRVPYDEEKVKGAPRVDADQHLSREEEQELYAYYGRGDYNEWDGRSYDADQGADLGAGDDRDHGADKGADLGADRRGMAATGDAGADHGADDGANVREGEGLSVTRHEERLNVGKEQTEAGRVRLRKYVTTEQQTVTVPVQKEVLSVERTPADPNQTVGEIHDQGEQVEEVVLREERPVVNKETVAVENVNVGKQTVTEQHQVTEQVAKEHVEVQGDGVDANGRPIAMDTATDRGDDRSMMDKAKDKLDPDHDGDYVETGTDRNVPDGDNRSFVQKAKDKLDGNPNT